MIVEDEMLVRIGLRNIIDWKELGVELVEDACDGVKALEIYQRERPDIILTDIRMPELDGLSLIRAIREKDERCRILILTCVEDFEIAKKAISYNVSGYLLKLTMTFDEIQSMICKAVDELGKMSPPVPQVRTADYAAVNERFLKDFFFYRTCSPQEFEGYVRSYHLNLRPNRLVVGVLTLLSYQSMKERFRDQKGDLVSVSILNILQELMESAFPGEVFHDAGPDYVMILNLPSSDAGENEKLLGSFRARVQEIMKVYFDTQLFLCFSTPCDGFERLRDAYWEVSQTLRQHFYLSCPAALQPDESLLSIFRETMESVAANPFADVIFDRDEKEKYLARIEAACAALPTPAQARAVFAELAELAAYSFGSRVGVNYLDELERHLFDLQAAETLQSLQALHLRYLEWLLEKTREQMAYSPEIEQALAYIEAHFTEELSLKAVADHVHLSSNYFSNLFKKEVGQKFVDYINTVRIDRAKKLLLTSPKRTQQISEETGFSDSAYFSKVFKRATGLSPAEYRKAHLGSGETGL